LETNIYKSETKNEGSKSQTSLLADIVYLLIKLAIIIGLFVLLFIFIFGIYKVSDNSMSPNIKDGDLVTYYRLDKDFKAGDPIVIRVNQKYQVRRVVAVAGDQVNMTKDGLEVNGSPQKGLEIEGVTGETLPFKGKVLFPLTVPKNQVFILGDNREKSEDSRSYGPVKVTDISGKLMFDLRRRNL
jgi:signal peptidase I, bacterial type